MGWFQDNLWNNVFTYAYPISFMGAMAYGLLAIAQVDISSIITNKNWLVAFNVFIGLCGIMSLASWFGTDISALDGVTTYIDLKAATTVSKVKKDNR